jgi:hypothetical protein
MVSAGPCEGVRPILFLNGCAPGWNRTSDNPLRRRVLYPTELQAHFTFITRWGHFLGHIHGDEVLANSTQ